MDPALLEIFRAEVSERTVGLIAALAGTAWPPAAGSLVLMAHSLRGAARVCGLINADRLAGAMQALLGKLDKLPRGPSAATRALLVRVPAWFDALTACADDQLVTWDEAQAEVVTEMVAQMAAPEALAPGAPAPGAPATGAPATGAPATGAPANQTSRQPPPQAAAVAAMVDLRQADDAFADNAILDMFRAETETHARAMSDGLMALERAADRGGVLDGLMRAAHSIKGAARIVGLDAAVGLAHELEEHLIETRGGKHAVSPVVVDVLLAAVDLLAQLAKVPASQSSSWLQQRGPAFVQATARVAALRSSAATLAADSGTVSAAAPDPAPVPPAPAPAPAPAISAVDAGRAHTHDSVVRVSTADINRMLALAGEVRVQTHQLRPMTDELARLQSRQTRLVDLVDQLRHSLGDRADVIASDLLHEVRRTARQCRQSVVDHLGGLHAHIRRSEDIGERLYRQSIASRMRPFGDGVRGFPRLVRDLSRRLGKDIDLEIAGATVGVDRDILDRLDAPLGHMLRNAIDHGIEAPAERRAAGKPERGTIRLEARHAAGRLSIRVSDDGRGIDPDRVRAKIVARGLADDGTVSRLSDAAVLDYLFRPGFSTTDQVTDVSGRGVGLDVVQEMVRAVDGSLRLHSEPGRGTTMHLQVPITLSVMRAVLVTIAGDDYALPLRRTHRVLSLPAAQVRTLENHQYFTLDGRHVALANARDLLELGGEVALPDPLCVVVIGERDQVCGLAVDRFLGEQDVVVRPLDRRLGKLPDVSAVTITADGNPMLILDVDDLLHSVASLAEGGRRARVTIGEVAERATARKRILVVDDSLTVREAERQMLVNAGYEVVTAVDGLEGRELVSRDSFDLVVTDVDMPRLDGIALVRFIKQDPRLSGMPVMIVSYRDREADRLRGLEAGADYYLTKSNFHDDTLIDAVVDLIGEPVARP